MMNACIQRRGFDLSRWGSLSLSGSRSGSRSLSGLKEYSDIKYGSVITPMMRLVEMCREAGLL